MAADQPRKTEAMADINGTRAGDHHSDYMRGIRNGVALVLASIGRDPAPAVVTRTILDINQRAALTTRAEVAEAALYERDAEIKHLRTALALMDHDTHKIIRAALGAEVQRQDDPPATSLLANLVEPASGEAPDNWASRQIEPGELEEY
jgi:hypothetical protein